MLGMVIKLQLRDVPPKAKNVPLGQKKKHGRPVIVVKKVLIVQ
jgi:hypothetical protein